MNDEPQPSHSVLDRKLDQTIALAKAAEERAEEAVSTANDNKTRLDEIAGAPLTKRLNLSVRRHCHNPR